MDRIKKINRLLHLAKSEVSKSIVKKSKTDYLNKSASPRTPLTKKKSDLKNIIVKKIGTLDQSDSNFINKARRVFLESTLEWEFGSFLKNNSIYLDELIHDIDGAIQNDPQTLLQMNEMIIDLSRKNR